MVLVYPRLAFVVLAVLAASGCVARSEALGTTASPCFAGLPAAAKVAAAHAALIGVRIEPAPVLNLLPDIEPRLLARSGNVCLYAFRRVHVSGAFRGVGSASGAYVVVAVYPGAGTVLVDRTVSRLPLDFGHDGIGDR